MNSDIFRGKPKQSNTFVLMLLLEDDYRSLRDFYTSCHYRIVS